MRQNFQKPVWCEPVLSSTPIARVGFGSGILEFAHLYSAHDFSVIITSENQISASKYTAYIDFDAL